MGAGPASGGDDGRDHGGKRPRARRRPRAASPAAPPAASPVANLPASPAGSIAATALDGLDGLQARLGHTFADPGLLILAMTHSSFIYEARLGRARANGDEPNRPGTDNEQLEFLGDAVLGLAVTELLLDGFPERTEGELTRMRSAIVSRKRMAELGEALELSTTLRLGRSVETGEGRQKVAVLANTAEAVLGAVYLDVQQAASPRSRGGERALGTVRTIVERLLVAPELPAIRAALEAAPGRGALRDAKSRLQECVQAVGAGRVIYVDAGEDGPAHARQFTVEVRVEARDGVHRGLARGQGGSKKEAQQAAATLALERWPFPEGERSAVTRRGTADAEPRA